MRDDMFKVIVERPRPGSRSAPRVKSRLDPVPERTKVGMKRAAVEQNGWTKWPNENLAPLRRYLWKQRNRPWSKVYGEICAKIDSRHTVKQHVRDHIEDFIVTRVSQGRDGALLGQNSWSGLVPLLDCRQALYVDPRDGIIKETAKLRRRLGLPPLQPWRQPRQPVDNTVISLSETEELRQIGGIWYALHYAADKSAPVQDRAFDLLSRKDVWPGERHAVAKHQLSKAELAAHGISNST